MSGIFSTDGLWSFSAAVSLIVLALPMTALYLIFWGGGSGGVWDKDWNRDWDRDWEKVLAKIRTRLALALAAKESFEKINRAASG